LNRLIGGEDASLRSRVGRAVLLLLSLPALASGQTAGVLSPAYEAVVRRYSSGDREGAVAEMVTWPERRLRDEIPALNVLWQRARICGDCPAANLWLRFPVRAALMLHSDCAQRARRDRLPPRLHESVAVEIARMLKDDSAHRAFARRWYEAMAGLAQGENRWGEALDWAERGLRGFPDSAEMLLVLGSIEETVGAQAAPSLSREVLVDPSTRQTRSNVLHLLEVREHLENAHRALRSAVAADPSLAEARLRLGRVAWRLGETAEARSAFEEVLTGKPKPATAFLAHLFLGRLDEDAGRLADATRAYGTALAFDTRSQSARIALSHVFLRLGNAGAARSEMEKAVGFAGRRPEPDAFWLYPWGPSVGVEERLEAMRREASS
jgi:tetratricopeptide (TPR) repeat protein